MSCRCGKQFRRNKPGLCPACKQPAQVANYTIDLAGFAGRGSCTCKLFRCSVGPAWARGRFDVAPCKHLIQNSIALEVFRRMSGVSAMSAPQARSSALLECVLRVEHGWVTMRNRAGKLLWTDAVKNVDTHQGIVLADLEPLLHEGNKKWKHSNDQAHPSVGIGELFDRCVVRTCGGRSIRCCLGLWAVSAPDKATAERKARHYWQQYFGDGEYQKHLSNDQDQEQRK